MNLFFFFQSTVKANLLLQDESADLPARQNGITYVSWWNGQYSSPGADRSLRNLAETGAAWVSLLVTGYQDDVGSTDIAITREKTPTDEDLIHAIEEAHALGLQVMLKPHVDLFADPDHWRGQIGREFASEADWEAWFSSYRDFIFHYAELAEAHGVDQFCAGTELVGTTHREEDWRRVLEGVRARFSGPVTYASNHSGRCAVARLIRSGHEVKVIGRREAMEIEGGAYRSCDINDYAGLREQVRGMEGIVHLAAIPYPGGGTPEEIFRVNCEGTFNVYQAAAEEGIKRVVSASSINALGYNFGVKSFALSYFPIDEEHPCVTTDAYSFSKQILEDTADYFWRREGISGVCLRLPGVYEVEGDRKEMAEKRLPPMRKLYDEIMDLPEEERKERVRGILAQIEALRQGRAFERRDHWKEIDRDTMHLIFGIDNFWTSIDAEDSAQALEKGLLADYEGSHPLFVNDSHNIVGLKSELLVRTFFPDVQGRTRKIEGTEALVSIGRARELLDFEPEYSVSNWW